ncbi:hypothetical protein [Bacillus infantis]|uniref:hypothetical protein n=1 Tax=Bacillus infantis TaxID=324767 RepID=UPI002E84B97E|nr:hypothetical protein [Bacillus infantis]
MIYLNQPLKTAMYSRNVMGAKLIETDAYFLEASRYIYRNLLEAKMVIDLYAYPWSSYPSYIDLTQTNPLITHNRTL